MVRRLTFRRVDTGGYRGNSGYYQDVYSQIHDICKNLSEVSLSNNLVLYRKMTRPYKRSSWVCGENYIFTRFETNQKRES